jgi:phage portal protein BeeE
VVRPKNASEGFEVAGDDLVYFSLPDPSDPFGCLSPLQSQAPAVATDEAIQVAQFRSFKNGIFPGVMIRAGRLPNMLGGTEGPRPVLTQAQRSELTEAIKKSYRGVQNYHEPLIVDGLIESVEKFSLTPAELDFLNSGQVTKARIFQAFGVSPFAVGQVENGNRAAMIVAQQTFAENVLNPLIALLSESMTAWLGPRYAGKGERLIVWVDPVVPKDSELDAQNWNNALRAGACSVNEYRRNVLNAADMPGGDKPLNPLDALVGNSVKAMAVDQVGTREAPEIYSWGWDLRNELEARRNGNGHAEAVR